MLSVASQAQGGSEVGGGTGGDPSQQQQQQTKSEFSPLSFSINIYFSCVFAVYRSSQGIVRDKRTGKGTLRLI